MAKYYCTFAQKSVRNGLTRQIDTTQKSVGNCLTQQIDTTQKSVGNGLTRPSNWHETQKQLT